MAESNTSTGSFLSPSQIPQATNIVFTDTLFFVNGHGSLPTTSEVRQAAGLNQHDDHRRPLPVVFPAQRLIVKWGTTITIAEGQCLWSMKHFLPSVPVSEVYGWCQDSGQTFIFMELVDGYTLEKWPEMDPEDRYDICRHLYDIISDLRQLRQEPGVNVIGDINHQPLHDILFDYNQPAGPFEGVPAFHDWITALKRGIYAKPNNRFRKECLMMLALCLTMQTYIATTLWFLGMAMDILSCLQLLIGTNLDGIPKRGSSTRHDGRAKEAKCGNWNLSLNFFKHIEDICVSFTTPIPSDEVCNVKTQFVSAMWEADKYNSV